MLSMTLGDRVLWRRVKDYVKRHKPFIIGVAGVGQVELTRLAIAKALGDDRSAHVPEQKLSSAQSIAKGILNIDELDEISWWSLLARSLVKEITSEEPDTIILSLYPNMPGVVDWLSEQLPWQMMVLTDVGTVRQDYFHDISNVAHELTSSVAALPKEAMALVNVDDILVNAMGQHSAAQIFSYGTGAEADIMAHRFERRPKGGFAGAVKVHNKEIEMHLPNLVGRWQILSAIAGLQVAHLLGVEGEVAAKRLQSLTVPPGHLKRVAHERGFTILDHSAALTPEAYLADLETLRATSENRSIAVLSELAGLAGASDMTHRRLGKFAGQTSQIVIGLGQHMRAALGEAAQAGADTHHFDGPKNLAKWLPKMLTKSDTVLLSGGGPELRQVF